MKRCGKTRVSKDGLGSVTSWNLTR